MSMNRGMDKENMIYAYNVSLFGLKKEGNPDILDNMDEPEDITLSELSQLWINPLLYDDQPLGQASLIWDCTAT